MGNHKPVLFAVFGFSVLLWRRSSEGNGRLLIRNPGLKTCTFAPRNKHPFGTAHQILCMVFEKKNTIIELKYCKKKCQAPLKDWL